MASKRKCKCCGEYVRKELGYISRNNMFFCDINHAVEWTKSEEAKKKVKLLKKESEKEHRAETRKIKHAQKTISQLKIETEKSVNAYIRVRDFGKPCSSCGRPHKKGDQAGHFIAVGDCDYLRFWTTNIHTQCVSCNLYGRGEYRTYRQFMVAKYGTEKVEKLEAIAKTNPIHKPSREHLERMKNVFNRRARHLKKLRDKNC